MTLLYSDHTGMLVSISFDVNKDPKSFIRVIVGLVYINERYLGLDPSVSVQGDRGHALLKGIKYTVEDVVYAEHGVIGRGTVCYKVTDRLTTYALKDAWVAVLQEQKEAAILKELNKLGVTHIPTLKSHVIVQIDGVNDSTRNIRSAIHDAVEKLQAFHQPCAVLLAAEGVENKDQEPDADNRELAPDRAAVVKLTEDTNADDAAKSELDSFYIPFLIRDHHRLLLWPFCRPLTDFRCLEELLLGIKDIIGGKYPPSLRPLNSNSPPFFEAIQQLQEHGYLHRDVSPNNVMLAIGDLAEDHNDLRKRLEGFLIDFDNALKISNASKSELATRIVCCHHIA